MNIHATAMTAKKRPVILNFIVLRARVVHRRIQWGIRLRIYWRRQASLLLEVC